MRRAYRRRWRDERSTTGEHGYVAAELALGIGLLVFPVALLVLTLPTWSERQSAARAIAREAARTTAVKGVCDTRLTGEVVESMARNLGLRAGDVRLRIDCAAGRRLARGSAVTASVTVAIPAVDIPGIGAAGGWHWTAEHAEPVDQYRSLP